MATVRCAWWNLHNLFPFVPGKTGKDWPVSEADYTKVLQARASALQAMPSGPPHLAGFCELAAVSKTGGRDALADLKSLLPTPMEHYLARACDERGITLGMLWDATAMELSSGVRPIEHPVRPDLMPDTEYARPIVELQFRELSTSRDFTVLLNHWKSRLGGVAETEQKRRIAAETLLNRVQELTCTARNTAADPDALVMALGDFNDEPFCSMLTNLGLGPADWFIERDRSMVLNRPADEFRAVLYNPCWRLLGEKLSRDQEIALGADLAAGTYCRTGVSRGRWATLDQVIVSAGMLQGPIPVFAEDSLQVHCDDSWFPGAGKYAGVGDHLPLTFTLRF